VLHVEGLTLTGRELHAALEQATGHPLRIAQMPWWLLKLASPLSPMMRALLEMRYLWDRPHRLDGSKLAQLIGKVPSTPLVQIVRDSLTTGKAGAAGMVEARAK
jgi:nucleoside-diphosphate-sugar epimerase